MKRIKAEIIFHVGDGEDETTIADKIVAHLRDFRLTGTRSANARGRYYETCLVSVERKTWDEIVKDEK